MERVANHELGCAMNKILLTGFPGFIGRRIVARLAQDDATRRFVLLVEQRMLGQAQQVLQELRLSERAQLVVGDLTQPQLGVASLDALQDVSEAWHLAAIYNLAVEEAIARRVNVEGTRHVLDVCESLPALQRLIYFSTCYVAGGRSGTILENELDVGQTFNNHYESTKFAAELEVRSRSVPAVIIRPAVVVGDSQTGETEKYDGPYYIIRALMRAPRWLPLPMVGPGTETLNIVPVDFIVNAAVAIAANSEAIGTTCQLADPKPMSIEGVIGMLCDILERPRPVGRLPIDLVDQTLRWHRLQDLLGVPRETVRYMHHPVRFDTRNTDALLAPTSVRCPPLASYLPTLVRYVQMNPDKTFLDGRSL